MKLSIISPDLNEACYIYRGMPWTRLPIEYREYDGKKGFSLFDAVIWADVVLMCRPFTKQQLNIATTIKDAGKALVVDFDDSYVNMSPWNPNKKAFEGCKPTIEAFCKMADAITVSSKFLQEEMLSYGAKKVVLIKNAIDDGLRNIYHSKERTKAVMWRGSNTHSADLDEGKALFFDMASKGYEIIFFGDAPPYAYQLKNRHFGVTDYANMLTTMAKLAPEYFYVPLANHPFNHAKSDCAASEAYLIGAKLIHSNFGEFEFLPEVGTPRWLSEVNPFRMEVLRDFHRTRA